MTVEAAGQSGDDRWRRQRRQERSCGWNSVCVRGKIRSASRNLLEVEIPGLGIVWPVFFLLHLSVGNSHILLINGMAKSFVNIIFGS